MTESSSNKIKIGFFFSYGKVLTGGPNTLLSILQLIDQNRFDPILFTQKHSEFEQSAKGLGVTTKVLELPERLKPEEGAILSFGLISKILALKDLIHYNFKIAKEFRREKVEILWARNVKSLILSAFGAKISNISVVWDIALEYESKGIVRILHLIGLVFSKKIVLEAEHQKQFIFGKRLSWIFRNKLLVIDSAVTPARYQRINNLKKGDNSSKYLICVGLVGRRKNQLVVIKSMRKIYDDFQMGLKIVGPIEDPDYQSEIEDYVHENKLESVVSFLGWREDIPELIGNSFALILMSKNEGVPHVIKEAMLIGTPVIATKVGGIPNVVIHEKSGLLIESNSTDLISEVRRLKSDNALYHSIVSFSKKMAEARFIPANEVRSYEQLFNSIFDEKN